MSLRTNGIGISTGKVGTQPTLQFNPQKHGVAKTFSDSEYTVTHPRTKYDGEIAGPLANNLDYVC